MVSQDVMSLRAQNPATTQYIRVRLARNTDHLRSITSGVLVESKPLDAISMINQIGDPAARQSALIHVLNRWIQTDASAAQDYLATAKLPPAIVGRVKIAPQMQP